MNRPLSELKTRIIEYLGGLSAFEDAAVVAAYPEKGRAFPLKKPVVTVETGGLDLSPAGFGSYLGSYVGEAAPVYGAAAAVSLRFGLYGETAEVCVILFETLCNALLGFDETCVIRISCDKTVYDAKNAVYFLSATAEIKSAWVLLKPQERLFGDIDLQRK